MSRLLSLFVFAFALTGSLALESHDNPWPCASDSDCSGGTVCRALVSGSVCAPANYCEASEDCALDDSAIDWQSGATWSCTDNRCVAPSCSTNADCTPYLCN